MKRLAGVLGWMLIIAPSAQAAQDDMRGLIEELAAQVKELKNQVRQSNVRIGELESELARLRVERRPQAVASAPAVDNLAADAAAGMAGNKPAVVAGDVKGTFKVPGSDLSLGLGGFVKMDALFANLSAGRDRLGDQQLVFSQIPVGNVHGEHSQTTFHAKESRIWLRAFSPSPWGEVNTYVELDFYGDPATYTYTPRLRHAYGSIGRFLAGQTWSTFLNSAALPDHLDPAATAGSVMPLRQPLVRWSEPFDLAETPMELQVALESPRSRIRAHPAADADVFAAPNAERYPDMVARLNARPDWGNLSLAGLARQIRTTDPIAGREAKAWGGALSLAGRIDTFELDNLRFVLNYGNALGRYATANTFEDAVQDVNGELRLADVYGGMASYQHFWSKQWRSTLSYGYVQADRSGLGGGNLTRRAQSAHANLLWSPVSPVILGMEYVYAIREAQDGRQGDLHRIQFSARYNF